MNFLNDQHRKRELSAARSFVLSGLVFFWMLVFYPAWGGQGAPPPNPANSSLPPFHSAGSLSSGSELYPGVPFPLPQDPSVYETYIAIRDAVYNNDSPSRIEAMATQFIAKLTRTTLPNEEIALLEARLAYLVGRAYKDVQEKNRAVTWFDRAIAVAGKYNLIHSESPAGILALTEPLAEVCLLKDLQFLISNGPKIGRNADKVLAMEPDNIKALLLKAGALAYPPPIWGGNYRKALELLSEIVAKNTEGLPKDTLFDMRSCIATAYANLHLREQSLWWFASARELYPQNLYVKQMMEKLEK